MPTFIRLVEQAKTHYHVKLHQNQTSIFQVKCNFFTEVKGQRQMLPQRIVTSGWHSTSISDLKFFQFIVRRSPRRITERTDRHKKRQKSRQKRTGCPCFTQQSDTRRSDVLFACWKSEWKW